MISATLGMFLGAVCITKQSSVSDKQLFCHKIFFKLHHHGSKVLDRQEVLIFHSTLSLKMRFAMDWGSLFLGGEVQGSLCAGWAMNFAKHQLSLSLSLSNPMWHCKFVRTQKVHTMGVPEVGKSRGSGNLHV